VADIGRGAEGNSPQEARQVLNKKRARAFSVQFNLFDRQTLPAVLTAMNLTIALFGIAREIVGQSQLDLTLPPDTSVQQLLSQMQAQYPGLSQLSSLAVARNNEYAQGEDLLQERDEIALIPPVSGG
jgi:molybdopterin synthase sulfur carrier subunit